MDLNRTRPELLHLNLTGYDMFVKQICRPRTTQNTHRQQADKHLTKCIARRAKIWLLER